MDWIVGFSLMLIGAVIMFRSQNKPPRIVGKNEAVVAPMTARQARFLAKEVMRWSYHPASQFIPDFFVQGNGVVVWSGEWDPSTSHADCAELLGSVDDEHWKAIGAHIFKAFGESEIEDFYRFILTMAPAQVTTAVLAAYGYKEEEDVS